MNKLKTLAVALLLSCLALVPLSAQSTVGIYENFDSITTGVPTGWDNSDGTTTIGNYKWVSTQDGYSNRGLRFNSKSNQNGKTNFLKTPAVNLSSGLWQVRFMYKNPAGGAFKVYISTDGGATYTTEISNGALPNVNTWTEQTIQLASFLGTNKSNVKIVFKGTSNFNGTDNGYLYLDDVYIENVPTCKSPVNLTISNVLTNSADISWGLSNVGDVPSLFQITVTDAGGTQVYSKTDISGSTYTFTIPSLQANTTYTATMRSDCSVGGSTDYSRTASVTFTTACAPQALPYTETYDNLSALSNCGYYKNAQLSTSYSFTQGGKCVKLSTGTLSADDAYIIFPALSANNNTVECIMKVRGGGSEINFTAGVVTDPSDIQGTYVPVYNGTIQANDNSWQDILFNTSNISPSSSPTYICVYVGSGYYNSLYIDNVDIHAIPTCIAPANFRIVSNTHNSATLAWTSTASSFDVEITTGSTVTHQTATASPYTVTGLSASTNYSFRVKAICSASDQSRYTLNNVSCTTYCNPIAGTVFTEGAESTTGTDLPSCWLSGYFNPSEDYATQPFITQSMATRTGLRAFCLQNNTGSKNAWIASQGFDVPTAHTHQVTIWVYRDNTANPFDGLRVYISSAPGDTTGNSFVGFIPLGYTYAPVESAPGWNDYSFLINYTGVKYITIVGSNVNSGTAIYFDDVTVEPEPTCRSPRNIVTGTPTDVTCPISWTAGASETQWRLVYTLSKNGTPVQSKDTVVNQPNYTFINLDPSSNYSYTASVYAICNPDTSVARTATNAFSTACVLISQFPYTETFENDFTTCHNLFNGCHNFDCAATLSRSTTKAHGGSYSLMGPEQHDANRPTLALPMMDFSDPNGYTVKFWMYRDASNYKSGNWAREGFYIYTSSQNANLVDTTRIGFIPRSMYVAPTEVQAGWYEYSFDIPPTISGQKYLLVVYRCEYGQPGYIDDITVQVSTGCRSLTATATPSYTSADIIASDPAVTEWEIAYQENNQYATPTVDTAYTDTYTLTGLNSNTEYVYQVRRICPDTTSDWSSAQLFRTLIIPDTLPYISGFEDAADNAKWILTTEGWSNFYIGTDANAVDEGTHAIYVSYDNSTYGYNLNQQSQAYASRLFHFDALEYNISFRWKCTGGEINTDTTSIYDFGRVFLAPGSTELNGGAEWMTYGSFTSGNLWPVGMIPIDPANAPFMALATGDANGWNNISTPVNMVNNPGDYKLVFMWNNESGGAQYPLAIDQLAITPVNCRRPNVGVANLTSTSANVVVSNGLAYQVVVSSTPINVFDTVVTGDIVDTVVATGPVALTGLTANTSYYYTARCICDSVNISDWATPQEFTTECLASVPYNESFEVASVLDCWSSAKPDSVYITSAQAYAGVKSLSIDNTVTVSPELDVESMASYILSGRLFSTVAQNIEIGVVVDPTDPASGEYVSTVNIPANTWTEFTTGFAILYDPDYAEFAGARHFSISCYSNKSLYVDDLYFGPTPGCARPTNPVITDTVHNGFTMTWTDSNASEWIVAVTPTAGGNTLTATSTTQSIVFTGLTEQTQYAVSLAAICSNGDTSLYLPCGVITTPVYVPTCDDPTQAPVVEATTMTTMTVSANNPGIYAVIQFVCGPATMVTSPDQCTISVFTTGDQAQFSGLSANLDYNVWYRGICEPGDTSRWSSMATGRTTYNNFFMPQNPHVVGYPEQTTVIAWGGAPDADIYEFEVIGDTTFTVTTDTAVLTGLSNSTTYNCRVRAISTTIPDTTAWVTFSFKTIAIPAVMPYVCDFESAVENNSWILENGSQSNYFTIDSINFGGNTACLFVTNDGSTTTYSNTPSTVYAYRTMTMMAGIYNVQFNWMCAGEPSVNPGQGNDYPRVFLAPVLMELTAGTVADGISYSTLPDGCIALEDGTHLTQCLSKRNQSGQVYVPQSGIYNLVVFWTNDNSLARDPAIVIDDINIYPQQCVAPGVTLVGTTQTTADVAVVNYSQTTSSIAYALSYGSRYDAFRVDTMNQPDTIHLTDLTLGTHYNLYVASTCAGEDESLWTTLSFRTDCGTVDVPYTQGFEGLDYFYTPGALNTICWSDLNAGANYADYPNYRAATSGSMVTEGSRSLQLNGDTARDLYIILPAMTDPSSAQMAFDIAYESTSDCGIVYAGYMTDPTNASTFTSVLTTQRNTSFTRLNAIYGAIPTTARLAFRYTAGSELSAYALIDNIRVSKVVNGDVYNESVCYAQSYNAHGFNVPASQLSVGLNTLTRVAPGNPGCPDTVITANVTMLNEISTHFYDTICSGVPYSGYGFTIPNPMTKAYPRIETAVSGCDSTTYLNLYVIPGTEVVYDTICNGDSYSFHGQTYTSAGTYTVTYTSPRQCQIQATLHLFVDAVSHTTYETICKGESYRWYGTAYISSGTYTYQGINPRGCQVNDTLHLAVLDGDTSYSVQICSGQSYFFIDTLITTAGTYTRHFQDPYTSCMVTHTLTATEVSAKTETIYDNACEGKPYTGYGIIALYISQDTVITIQTKTQDMCDSFAYVHLHYVPTVTSEIYHVMNPGDHYDFDGTSLTEAGTYTAIFQTADGCDSVVTLYLSLGVETVSDIRIDVVPNPVNVGATALVYGDFGEINSVEVVNGFGQVIDTFTPASYPIEVNGISAAGVYYVRLITNSGNVHVQKLIVR